MRRVMICMLFSMISGGLFGQLQVFNQPETPENPTENTWHFNTKNTQISRFDGKDWQPVEIKFARHIREWQGYVRIKTSDMKALAKPNGEILMNPCHWILQDEALLTGFVCGHGTLLLNLEGDTLAFLGMKDIRRQFYQIDTVAGQRAYCAPQFVPGTKRINADRMHNWGMLNTKGEWLIEPRYDAYFKFKDGIAEVSYMGKPIKINESGELVD